MHRKGKAINIANKFAKFSELWSPKIIAQMNNYHFKLAKIKGEFIWHSHPETDEVFIVIKGSLTIDLREGEVLLKEGEMYVVLGGWSTSRLRSRSARSCWLNQQELSIPETWKEK